jgi:hypothetical protein
MMPKLAVAEVPAIEAEVPVIGAARSLCAAALSECAADEWRTVPEVTAIGVMAIAGATVRQRLAPLRLAPLRTVPMAMRTDAITTTTVSTFVSGIDATVMAQGGGPLPPSSPRFLDFHGANSSAADFNCASDLIWRRYVQN